MVRTSLSGFPEQLPEDHAIEMHVLDELYRVFELYGFADIETRTVETPEQLETKGETSKEIYALERLRALETATVGTHTPKGKGMGLHFDLTVPSARYVVENANELDSSFECHQIQEVWRGECPQDGRFRELTQADADVVDNDELPLHFEVDLPLVVAEALNNLPIPHVRVFVNNRRVVQGVCESLGVTGVEVVLRGPDKTNKTGPEGVVVELVQSDVDGDQASALPQITQIRTSESSGACVRLADLGVGSELLDEGLKELIKLFSTANKRMPGAAVANFKIAHGLDHYTSNVYEPEIEGHETLGSICPGEHYDSLTKDGRHTYPGIGLSIDVSRPVSRMISTPMVRTSRKVSMAVIATIIAENQRERPEAIAAMLCPRSISTGVTPSTTKLGKQIKFTDRHDVPPIWLLGEKGSADTVKDICSDEQVDADSHTWVLPEADAVPTIEKITD